MSPEELADAKRHLENYLTAVYGTRRTLAAQIMARDVDKLVAEVERLTAERDYWRKDALRQHGVTW